MIILYYGLWLGEYKHLKDPQLDNKWIGENEYLKR